MIIGGHEKKEQEQKKKSMSRILVPFIVSSIFIFTAAAIWLQFKIGMELSSTLVACFFTFMGSELAMLCSIKKTKVKRNNYYPEDDHRGGFYGGHGIFPFSETESEHMSISENDDGSVG